MKIKFLYHTYANLVFNLALQYTHNVEDAEEITQDVFLKIYNHLEGFNHQSNIKTWIYRITINQSLDFLKSKNRKKRSFLGTFFDRTHENKLNNVSDFNHPGIELQNKEAMEILMAKIHQLPENQKTVIILLKIEDLSQKQVAIIMNISESAVESLFQRAKTNLKKTL